jgi:hypothetical protein
MSINESDNEAFVIEHGASVFFLPAEPVGRDAVRECTGGNWADLQLRLGALLRGEMTSFLQARQYLQTARRYIAAARKSRLLANGVNYETQLEAARNAHRRARKCLSYARLCRERARTLGGGFGNAVGQPS